MSIAVISPGGIDISLYKVNNKEYYFPFNNGKMLFLLKRYIISVRLRLIMCLECVSFGENTHLI